MTKPKHERPPDPVDFTKLGKFPCYQCERTYELGPEPDWRFGKRRCTCGRLLWEWRGKLGVRILGYDPKLQVARDLLWHENDKAKGGRPKKRAMA